MAPRILLILLFALALPVTQAQPQTPRERAVEVTRGLLLEAHRALTGRDDAPALRRAIDGAFAFDLWERFLIAERAAAFSPAQRREFRARLPGFMAYLYRRQFERGLDRPPRIGKVRRVRRDYMVGTRFRRANGRDLPVVWRLRDIPGRGALVIDMMVGGTSFLLLKREEFRAIIDRAGAEGVLRFMRANSM